MNKIARFVIWICSKFNRIEIEQIIHGLQEVLADRTQRLNPKTTLKRNTQATVIFMLIPYLPLLNSLQRRLKPEREEEEKIEYQVVAKSTKKS